YHARTNISAVRSFFHIIGLFAGGAIPLLVVRRYADAPATGYAYMGFGIGAVMSCVALVTGLLAPEPRHTDTRERPLSVRSFFDGLRGTLANPAFRILLGAFALVLLGAGINQMLVPYVFRYWLGRSPESVSSVVAIYLAATVASLPLW